MVSKISSQMISPELTSAEFMRQNSSLNSEVLLRKDKDSDPKAVEEAATQFEALLLHQFIRSMWSTVEHEGLLGEDSNAAQIYRDMLNDALAKNLAEGEGIGIKNYVKRELLGEDPSSKPGRRKPA